MMTRHKLTTIIIVLAIWLLPATAVAVLMPKAPPDVCIQINPAWFV
jgi:hypothetical protein